LLHLICKLLSQVPPSPSSAVLQISKRDITLVDRSEFQVRLTLWGKQAKNYSIADQPVIAFKGVKVGDFGGRTLSMFSSSTMSVSPDIPEAHGLRGWFDSAASSTSFKSHSRDGGAAGAAAGTGRTDAFKTILEIKDENIGMNDKPDYVSIRATVLFVKKDNISYPACPGEGCQKKVTDTGDGWRCEKCDRTYPAPNHRCVSWPLFIIPSVVG
jgi:replication factor A1